ncbi:hypothetical protein EYF80_009060 [Liparis tanakae]|uniref:Uncharacterized protein n=1 Tax=Liparis tanakae TaxID=230148 RepID=A0A4Z2IRR8_9TELE|nr:hypothetical protein EYF80_009060 [Liparis tanakae]
MSEQLPITTDDTLLCCKRFSCDEGVEEIWLGGEPFLEKASHHCHHQVNLDKQHQTQRLMEPRVSDCVIYCGAEASNLKEIQFQLRGFPWPRDTPPLSILIGRCSASRWPPECTVRCCCRDLDNPLGTGDKLTFLFIGRQRIDLELLLISLALMRFSLSYATDLPPPHNPKSDILKQGSLQVNCSQTKALIVLTLTVREGLEPGPYPPSKDGSSSATSRLLCPHSHTDAGAHYADAVSSTVDVDALVGWHIALSAFPPAVALAPATGVLAIATAQHWAGSWTKHMHGLYFEDFLNLKAERDRVFLGSGLVGGEYTEPVAIAQTMICRTQSTHSVAPGDSISGTLLPSTQLSCSGTLSGGVVCSSAVGERPSLLNDPHQGKGQRGKEGRGVLERFSAHGLMASGADGLLVTHNHIRENPAAINMCRMSSLRGRRRPRGRPLSGQPSFSACVCNLQQNGAVPVTQWRRLKHGHMHKPASALQDFLASRCEVADRNQVNTPRLTPPFPRLQNRKDGKNQKERRSFHADLPLSLSDLFSCSVSVRVSTELERLDRQELLPEDLPRPPRPHRFMARSGDITA